LESNPNLDGKIHIGFLGNIAIRKGIRIFIQAIANFRECMPKSSLCFHIHGANYADSIYAEMMAAISKSNCVTYHGAFQQKDRAEIFSKLDLLVVPSLGENYPFIIRESLLAGVPVAASNIAGIHEIIKNDENGFLFPPNDSYQLSNIFYQIAQDPNRLSLLNCATFKPVFVDEEIDKLENIFEGIAYRKG
jgi:glycosyltransferase involved in cell wall biosynthesis